MSTRKKNADTARPKKVKPVPPPLTHNAEIEALLMIGEERMHIDHEENDNIGFMAEVIDS